MTLSAGTNPDDQNDPKHEAGKSEAGTALMPSTTGIGIDPFIASTQEAPPAPRRWHAKILDYSAHAAMIVGLIGFAWTVSGHVVKRDGPVQSDAPFKTAAIQAPAVAEIPAIAPPPAPPKVDEIGDLRRANHQMAADIKALHASLDALRGTVAKTPEQVQALTANLEDVKSGLSGTKSQTSSEIAQLSGKIDALKQEVKAAQTAEKTARLDHAPDIAPTGSIPEPITKTVPKPPVKPSGLASADEAPKPQVIAGWVVRDVYDGVAVIEGKRGPMEVVPGVSIPGAGVVKSIDRHGAGWTVTTTKGLLAYAAPSRDYRRANGRDYYPNYRYDF